MSTGQIFFVSGVLGLVASVAATAICTVALRRKEKEISTEIWDEYR